MYSSEGLLLQNFCTQQFLTIKRYKDLFFLPGLPWIFLGCVLLSKEKNVFCSFRTGLLKETRLQIIPMMDVKFNRS